MKPIGPVYKSAEELGITERERRELIEAIPYFLALDPAEFSMCNWQYCACGHIARLNGRDWNEEYKRISPALRNLYTLTGKVWADLALSYGLVYAKPTDAVRAIVAFLSA